VTFFGIVEYSGGEMPPDLVRADSLEELDRVFIEHLRDTIGEFEADAEGEFESFVAENGYPDPDADAETRLAWLIDMRSDCTDVWLTLLSFGGDEAVADELPGSRYYPPSLALEPQEED
jgi:hypothetical protein